MSGCWQWNNVPSCIFGINLIAVLSVKILPSIPPSQQIIFLVRYRRPYYSTELFFPKTHFRGSPRCDWKPKSSQDTEGKRKKKERRKKKPLLLNNSKQICFQAAGADTTALICGSQESRESRFCFQSVAGICQIVILWSYRRGLPFCQKRLLLWDFTAYDGQGGKMPFLSLKWTQSLIPA